MSHTAARIGATGPALAWRTLHLLLVRTPGRLRNSLMLVAGVCIVVTIWEVFRIPDAATACYVVLFISRKDRTSTIASASGVMVLGPVAVGLSILATMASLSDPALRLILMAVMTFAAMFLSRAARAGQAFFALGFIMVYAMTASDSVRQIALQPVSASNTAGGSLPAILFQPPEETLLHTLLWLVLSVVVPAGTVLLLNKAFGRDPAHVLRRGLDERLLACAAFCDGEPGAATRLEALARRGSPELLALAELAQKDHGVEAEPLAANRAAIRATARTMLACLAIARARPGAEADWMTQAASRCRALCSGGTGLPASETADPFGRELHRALDSLSAARIHHPEASEKPKAGFWANDAFAAASAQFGLKITLAVMVCVTINNALDWPGIGTDVVTCFFVALGTLGESGHKMTLRLAGCLVGAALSIGSVIVLMPLMTDIGHLLLLMAPITLLAAWIACGSERISYAGWQIALAFYTVVLQGFGPVTDMAAAKNRIIGILIGNVVTYFALSTLWPVRVDRLTATSLADALAALGQVLRHVSGPDEARERFMVAVGRAQSLLSDRLFEGEPDDRVPIDEGLISEVQALILPVEMIATGDHPGYAPALAAWLDDIAGRLRRGDVARGSFPAPPDADRATEGVVLLNRSLEALSSRR